MAGKVENPFAWLQALDALAKQRARGLPRQEKSQKMWRGIAFYMDNNKLVAPITEIREVLVTPKTLAKVPGSKPWIKGIANVRGLLLPVVDLQACLGFTPLTLDNRSRMMILNQPGVSAGVLVEEVMGIKHFPEENRLAQAKDVPSWYASFIRGAFLCAEADDTWAIFDMDALNQSRVFLDAAT